MIIQYMFRAQSWNRGKAIVMIALVFGLAGCNSLSPANIKAYLDGIAVTTPDLSAKADGVYPGAYDLAVPLGAIAVYHSYSVEVTIKSRRIDSIAVTKPKDTGADDVYNAVIAGPNGIIARQTLNVDALSGASFSSKAVIKAAENALSR